MHSSNLHHPPRRVNPRFQHWNFQAAASSLPGSHSASGRPVQIPGPPIVNIEREIQATMRSMEQRSTLRKLEAVLAAEDYDEEFLRPVPAVLKFARDLIAHIFAAATVGATGDGGLTVQWGTPDRYVRLLIPPDPRKAYLYSKSAAEKAVEEANAENLTRRISWLRRNG